MGAVTLACTHDAAQAWQVPEAAIVQVLTAKHTSGVGVMGIPEAWMPFFQRYGVTRTLLENDPCANISAGAWIIAFSQALTGTAVPSSSGEISGRTTTLDVPTRKGLSPITSKCVDWSARHYGVPVQLVYGVLATEGGRVGHEMTNRNGSVDIGPMQVNSSWLPKLSGFGITRGQLRDNGCVNVAIGTWILAGYMQGASVADPRDYWQHVGYYNSHTPYYNRKYAAKVFHQITKMFQQTGNAEQ